MGFCPRGDTVVNPVIKYVLLVGTFLHWVCGGAMVGIGIWAFIEMNKFYDKQIQNIYDVVFNLSIVLIVVGGVIFIITTSGFVGALRENTCLLKFFYIALSVIFLTEVVVSSLAFVLKDKAIDAISGGLKEVYVKGYQDDKDAVMDYFQKNFECCGIRGLEDWNLNNYFNCSDNSPSQLKCAVPYSCCKDPDELTNYMENKVWTIGCLDSVIESAEEKMPVIILVAVAIVLPQLIGIVLGRVFDSQIQRQRATYKKERKRISETATVEKHSLPT